jgi:anti-sigma-K factor RskA
MSENVYPPQSSGEPDCEGLSALLPAYSIGATTPEETQLVEALLPLCPEVAAELPEYVALTEAILQTVTPTLPPPALHDKLMALTASTAAAGTHVTQKTVTLSQPRVVPMNRFWIVAAALLALFLASNAFWALGTMEIRQTQEQLWTQLQQQNALIEGLTSGDVVLLSLNADQGNARVFWNTAQRRAILSTEGLPPLAADQTYQLWLISGDERTSAGIFQVDDAGRGLLIFDPPKGLSDYNAVGISMEPAGGSDAPTTVPIALGEI